MLIDFHTHAFPDKLAPRAMAALEKPVGTVPFTDGTVSSLLARMKEWHTDRAVICNIATNAKQTENVNTFAIETVRAHGDRLSPLGSLHPGYPEPERELLRLREAGIRGIKIHPDYMGIPLDDPAFDEIFALAADFGFFIVTHAGFDVFSPKLVHASPDRILRRMARSPRTLLIAAHYGGNMMFREVSEKLIGRDLWIDCSLGGFARLNPNLAAEILLRHDPEKILFGSDCPWASSSDTFRYIDALPLPDDRKEKIYWGNARRLLGL